MSELNPQPLPPSIELGQAVEVITSAILRSIEARGLGTESDRIIEARRLDPNSVSSLTAFNYRIIAGGFLDLNLRSLAAGEEITNQ